MITYLAEINFLPLNNLIAMFNKKNHLTDIYCDILNIQATSAKHH